MVGVTGANTVYHMGTLSRASKQNTDKNQQVSGSPEQSRAVRVIVFHSRLLIVLTVPLGASKKFISSNGENRKFSPASFLLKL